MLASPAAIPANSGARDQVVCDVEIEDLSSWPPEFLGEADKVKSLVCRYQKERQRIDQLAQEDLRARIDPPPNKYKAEYRTTVERLEATLVPHRLVGFHCTRLTTAEMSDIAHSGLRCLSPGLVYERIDSCVARGFLAPADGEYLRESTAVRDCVTDRFGRRSGLVWFCPNRSSLKDYSGVSRFFCTWGGEALYWGHEDDARIAPVLRHLGLPCVIKCAVPYVQAQQHHDNFSERLLAQFVAGEIEYPEPPPRFDFYTETDIAPSNICQIIVAGSSDFASLTAYRSWPEKHRFHLPTDG